MSTVLLVTADTAHAAYTRTKAALESKGHTVVGSLDTQAALDAANLTGVQVIATVRVGATSTYLRTWLRDRWIARYPLLLGGTELGATENPNTHHAQNLGLLAAPKTTADNIAASIYAQYLRVVTAHAINAGYAVGVRHQLFSAANFTTVDFRSTVAYGVEVGDVHDGSSSDYGVYQVAIEKNGAINAGGSASPGATAPTRAVFCGWFYAGQADYNATAKTLLDQTVQWLATPPPATNLAATLSAQTTLTGRAVSPVRVAAQLAATSSLSLRFADQSFPLAAQLSATSGLTAAVNTRSQLRATLSASTGWQARLGVRRQFSAQLSADSGLTARAVVHIRMDVPAVDLDLAVDVDDAALSVAQIDVAPIDLSLDVTGWVQRASNNPYRVHRWHFQNPVTGEDWSHPINPNAMTSPHRPREVVTTAGAGPHGSFESGLLTRVPPPQPKQWEFSGVIRTESHYQDLDRWAHMETPIYITDHLDRTWEVVIETFVPEDRQPTYRVPWRYRYTMRCLLMRRMR